MEKVPLPTDGTLITETIRSMAVDTGVVSSPIALGGNALTDTTKHWVTNILKNRLVRIIKGSGVGQQAVISGNSSDTLLIRGNWPQAIGAGALYVIFSRDLAQELRDVFGGGSDISEGSPLPVGGAASLNGFDSNQWAGRTLNNILTGRSLVAGVITYDIDIDNFRTAFASPQVEVPAIGDELYLYSRRFFKYPELWCRHVVADRAAFPDGSHTAVVFQGIGHQHLLLAGFSAWNVGGVTRLCGLYPGVRSDPAFPDYPYGVNLAAYLPADFMTAVHAYTCKLNKGTIEYRIDNAIVLAVVMAPDYDTPYLLAGPPYDVRIIPWEYNPCQGMFHIHIEDTNPIVIPGFSDGEPLPLRIFPLYTTGTNTQWLALATAGVVLTSHPIPVWGYNRKTLVFQADAAGNLDIQVYVGGAWRSWVPGGITLVANQLEVYNLNGEVPLVRCIYTPTNADTITLAEWHLG